MSTSKRGFMASKFLSILIALLFTNLVFSQENTNIETEPSYWKKHFEFGGYVKYMNTNSFTNIDSIYTDNLFHNRLNLRYNPNGNWSGIIEVRNRLFYGESVKYQPDFAKQIDLDNGIVDMSFNIIDAGSMILNSTIDRAYVEYNKNKWNVRVGRQRVNWGINLAWNPNDLYNAYNFTDFDYAERPGTDALRVQYYNKPMSRIELVVRPGESLDESIISALYKFNKKSYDIQFLASNFNTDLAAGLGWAGNLFQAGFKGEATYFHPKESLSDTVGTLAASISFDYNFGNGIYLNFAGLYNSSAENNADFTQFGVNSRELSAKNLMPTQFAVFGQVSGAFSPIFSGGMSIMYLPDLNGFFFNPTLNFSIVENWDIDAVGQLLFADSFESVSNAVYLRLRWSF